MSTKMPAQQILLVDDDAAQRGVVADILKGEGLDVCTVRTGNEATSALRQRRPPFGMVATNLVLLRNGGLEVIRAALECDPDCSVMAIGASASSGMAAEALASGAYAVVAQPAHLEHFGNAMLEAKVDTLETAIGRMEMLAQQISPAVGEHRSRPLEELEQLAALRSKGAMTEGRFQSMRQSLLMRWSS
jgi:DNA-binding NtrC family response regulator